MARRIPKNTFLNDILNRIPSDIEEELVSIGSTAARAKILYDRNFRGFRKDDKDNNPNNYDHENTYNRRPLPSVYRKKILSNRGENPEIITGNNSYTSEPANRRVARTKRPDSVSIIDIDYIPNRDDASRFYSYVTLPFVPQKLNYNPKSTFIGVPSFGRNNPYYYYTGSEDTLQFTIDWFSSINSRKDVIFYCRWLEALSKADSYEDVPHRIKLSWGNDNLMFDDYVWIVTAASYELSDFINSYQKNGNINKVGLLPQQAYQKITLRRITDHNLTASEIIGQIRPEFNGQ